MLKRTVFSTLALVISVTALSTQALAWGDMGHETTAAIAERLLANDPKTLSAIRAIIGVEPFGNTAIWPDAMRDDARFKDFAPYHYTTIYRDHRAIEKDAFTVLRKYPLILRDPTVSREAKMIALRYVMHVVGDVHQPLHVGNEFDIGGNACNVLWQPDPNKPAKKVNLHSAWDTNMVDLLADRVRVEMGEKAPKYFSYNQFADALIAKYPQVIANPGSDRPSAWVQESADLRENNVYPDTLPDDARPYCKRLRKGEAPAAMPTLDAAYIDAHAEIVEKRIVLGGARLAIFLKEIFNSTSPKVSSEQKILEFLEMTNGK